MILITILICIAVQRFANFGGMFKMQWFLNYLNLLRPLISKANKWIALSLIIIPIFILLWVLHLILAYKFFGIFYLLLSCMILFMCMDARDMRSNFTYYFSNIKEKNITESVNIIKNLIGNQIPIEENELIRYVSNFIFTSSFSRLFSILFWYIIFGNYGAIGYVVIMWLARIQPKEMPQFADIKDLAGNLQQILDWISMRFLGITYALGGHFKAGFDYCRKHFQEGLLYNETFTKEAGLAALNANIKDVSFTKINENEDALNLIDRVLIVWLIFAGVRVLLGLI